MERELLLELRGLPQLKQCEQAVASIVGIDCMGVDVKSGDRLRRLLFDHPITTSGELRRAVEARLTPWLEP